MLKRSIFPLLALISACSPFRLHLPERPALDGWLTVGGNLEQHHFRAVGPKPPLELVDTISLPASPVHNIVAIDSSVLLGTKNGRIYSYRLHHGKGKGKIKLPENVVGNLGLHETGLLVVALEIGRETLLCYDLRDGELRWKARAGLLSGEPVVADSSVYLVARFKHVDRYNIRDGKKVWRFDTESQAHTTPTLAEDRLYFGTDSGDLYALDRTTGAKIWQRDLHAAVFAAPVVDANRVYVSAQDSTVRAFERTEGTPVWTVKTDARGWRTPALSGNLLIAATGDGKIYGLDTETGQIQWQHAAPSGIGTSPLIVGNTVYFGCLDKHFYALDAETGELIWQTVLRGRVRTNPIAVGDYLIVGSEDKYIYIFREAQTSLVE